MATSRRISVHDEGKSVFVPDTQDQSSQTVAIGITLKKEKRFNQDMRQVMEVARSMGFEVTKKGLATLSLRTSPKTFEKIFGVAPTPVSSMQPSNSDAGAPAGVMVEGTLPIPIELQDFVEAISVVPPARRL